MLILLRADLSLPQMQAELPSSPNGQTSERIARTDESFRTKYRPLSRKTREPWTSPISLYMQAASHRKGLVGRGT